MEKRSFIDHFHWSIYQKLQMSIAMLNDHSVPCQYYELYSTCQLFWNESCQKSQNVPCFFCFLMRISTWFGGLPIDPVQDDTNLVGRFQNFLKNPKISLDMYKLYKLYIILRKSSTLPRVPPLQWPSPPGGVTSDVHRYLILDVI